MLVFENYAVESEIMDDKKVLILWNIFTSFYTHLEVKLIKIWAIDVQVN